MGRLPRWLIRTSLLVLQMAAVCCGPWPWEYNRPSDLDRARVDFGKEILRKSIFYEQSELGPVTDLYYGHLLDDKRGRITVVCTRGATTLTEDGGPVQVIHFQDKRADRVRLIQMKANGPIAFLSRGNTGDKVHRERAQAFSPIMLFDGEGRVVWSVKTDNVGFVDAAAGDVNGDGSPEFILALGDKLHLLDANGREIWSRDDAVYAVAIVDPSGDGHGEIVYTNYHLTVKVRNGAGDILAERNLQDAATQLTAVRWGNELEASHLLLITGEPRLMVYDLEGRPNASLETPGCTQQPGCQRGRAIGVPVRFSNNAPHYATVIDYLDWNRSVFYLHDQSGQLVYREIIEGHCEAVQTVPCGAAETLLIGCANRVWQYQQSTGRQK